MKKTLVALAALSAIAGVAHAQSSVTIYGVLDETLQQYHYNTKTGPIDQSVFVDGGFLGSRLGFKGSEDLGGGQSAIFQLEAGITLNNGESTQGSTLFGRMAVVGLAGQNWGSFKVGRNASPLSDVSSDGMMMEDSVYDPTNTNNGPQKLTVNTGTVATALTLATLDANLLNRGPGVNGNTTWIGFSQRFNNSVKYETPNWNGFTGSFMYATGQDNTVGAAAQSATNTTSAYAKYVSGPFLVSLGYQSESLGGTEATTAAGLTPSGTCTPTATCTFTGSPLSVVGTNANSPANAALSLKPALVNTQLNLAYDFGVARIGAAANQAQINDVYYLKSSGVVSTIAAQNEYSLSVSVPFGATLLSAGYAVSQGDTLGKATGYGIQAKYALSKRTFIYGGYTSQSPYDNLVAATQAAGSANGTDNITSYGIGINHKF